MKNIRADDLLGKQVSEMCFAGRLGIEPRFTASKAAVLPLDDLPAKNTSERAGSMVLHTFRRSGNIALGITHLEQMP